MADSMWGVYAVVCGTCDHLSSRHGLVENGDLRDGPYRCLDCDCEIAQEHPHYTLTEAEFNRWTGPKWEAS